MTILYFSFLIVLPQYVFSQIVSFSHLTTSNGLSDNNAQSLAIDKNGFLWVGTTDGLNVYDGYSITSYFKASEAGLPSDTILQLYCDSRNRIWVIAPARVSWADEQKKFHAVQIPVKGNAFACYSVFETARYGIILFTSEGHYWYNEHKNEWEKIEWLSQMVGREGFNTAISFTKDRGIYVFEQRVVVIDYNFRKIIFTKDIPNAVSACRYNDDAIAVATRSGNVQIFDIASQQKLNNYDLYNEVNDKKSKPRISEMYKASNGSLVIATRLSGLMIIDSINGQINTYQHDPLNPFSVSANILYRVLAGTNGEVITGSQNHGVSICNISNKRASYTRIFKDTNGNIFDGPLNEIAEEDNGVLWIGAIDRLIRWDKKNNTSTFYQYQFNDPVLGPRNLEIRTLCIDKKGRIWLGVIGAGVVLFNQHNKTFQLITKDTSLGRAVQNTYVNHLIEAIDGNIWACTFGGIYTINPDDHHITVFQHHPVLKDIAEKIVISLYEDAQKRIWLGTQRYGLYCYDPRKNQLLNYNTTHGLLHNTGNSITADPAGNIYMAHLTGFSVVAPNGKIRSFSRANGLRYYRCEGILPDNDGNMWIANNKGIVKYTAYNNKLEYFEENAGISTDGFRFDAALKGKDGNLYFCTHRGINYFDPLQLKNHSEQLRVNIYQLSLPDSVFRFNNSPVLKVPYSENTVQFYFTAINLTGSRNIAYQYILEGFDKDWQKGNDIHFARYSSLPPGHYTFKIKASIDRVNWTGANNNVVIDIVPPFWKKWWFIVVAAILFLGLIIAVFRFRINQVRYKERLKTVYNKKISETEMKALRAQMNPHFIFNCLNSINKYILKSDHVNASRYLTRFAKLIRLILDNSNSKEVALSNELEALELYIDMESLRFANKFTYSIDVDADVSPDSIQLPPLIIQPYVENAIWHGLLHKKSGGHLIIRLKMINEGMLQCEIEDNGIGREKAMELKSKSVTTKKSLGMKLTEERINMLNQYASLNASINIVDMANEKGEAEGTKVILTIPV